MGYHDINGDYDLNLRPVSSVEAWRRRNDDNTGMDMLSCDNDNLQTRTSGLTFRGARDHERRSEDLDWQIRFAKMKLRGWHDPDNCDWGPLDTLLNDAVSKRIPLG